MSVAWNSWQDFWSMGGYGLYVWGSFGVTALVLVGEVWALAARRRALVQAEHDSMDDDNTGEFPHET